jgi:hypothetical protein
MPIWISSPAKVKKLGVVQKIIASIFDANGDAAEAITNNDLLLGTRQKFTPYNYQVLLLGNQLQILKQNSVDPTRNSLEPGEAAPSNMLWHSIVEQYGSLVNGISQIRLNDAYTGGEIVGTVAYHPGDDKFLLFTVDTSTTPQNTLLPINAIIDPERKGPNHGLPAPALGQRYLLVGDTNNAEAWTGASSLTAYVNDIVEWNGSTWIVVFDSQNHLDLEYVTNITTEIQYRWVDGQWLKSYEGLYAEGEWSLVL